MSDIEEELTAKQKKLLAAFTIDDALKRAMHALNIAYMGKSVGDPDSIWSADLRKTLAEAGTGYAQLAQAMQVEREWEATEMRRIAQKALETE